MANGNIKLTQRDMLLHVYRAVCGNGSGEPGLIHDVRDIRENMMTKEECAATRQAQEAGGSKRWDRTSRVFGIVLPAASLLGVVLLGLLK